ncbi:MAG: B12-binding domain-containing radical SAM protein [Planctomycetes bacterium]|nr:B12-binding domain-containing radical SAM protein [Planctomycetota bacterium]
MTHSPRRRVLLVQLPIPPLGPAPVRGNVPLAAAYLKLFAERQGLGRYYDIDILPARLANSLGDRALVEAIVQREPWLIGFTCYLWNIERTLWIAREVKRRRPEVRIVLGGPEVTADNRWVLDTPDYDLAVIGEGEQTFAQLLHGLREGDLPAAPIPGLYLPAAGPGPRYHPSRQPAPRTPLADLNLLGSPYLAGILDAAEEEMLLLETSRGCRYRCRFCYYWKSYDKTYFLADETIRASLRHAVERGAREVFLLDPTLNQRKDFADLLRLLAEGNPGGRFSYFGELRGEGVTEETARLLRAANFTEVEVGLQSIEPDAMTLMDRKNNLRAFERGVRAMMGQGIQVKVDLIIGLPGDTVASVRRGLHYLRDQGLGNDLQVFNLAVLPGTAFREDAARLGLVHQPRPPYYVLQTPALARTDLFGLMQEAQDLFDLEFDAQPAPVLDFGAGDQDRVWEVDLDRTERPEPPPAERRAQAFTLWLRSARFGHHGREAAGLIRGLLESNPFTTLQVVLEPVGALGPEVVPQEVGSRLLGNLMAACLANPTYLDKYYALQPGGMNGAKRLILVLPRSLRERLPPEWREAVGETATLVWRAGAEKACYEEETVLGTS